MANPEILHLKVSSFRIVIYSIFSPKYVNRTISEYRNKKLYRNGFAGRFMSSLDV